MILDKQLSCISGPAEGQEHESVSLFLLGATSTHVLFCFKFFLKTVCILVFKQDYVFCLLLNEKEIRVLY